MQLRLRPRKRVRQMMLTSLRDLWSLVWAATLGSKHKQLMLQLMKLRYRKINELKSTRPARMAFPSCCSARRTLSNIQSTKFISITTTTHYH